VLEGKMILVFWGGAFVF